MQFLKESKPADHPKSAVTAQGKGKAGRTTRKPGKKVVVKLGGAHQAKAVGKKGGKFKGGRHSGERPHRGSGERPNHGRHSGEHRRSKMNSLNDLINRQL